MKNKALALGIMLAVLLPGTAWAAGREYDGGPLATKNGPAYLPETLDDVARRAAISESYRRLQDEPDQQTEEVIRAKKETAKEKKAREERGEESPSQKQSELPVTIFGDHVIYHSDTGEFTATGNVRLYQGSQRLYTTEARGNAIDGDVYLLQGGRMIDSPSTTDAEWGHYNFKTRTGTVRNMKGTNGDDLYKADIARIYPDRTELTSGGSVTRCPAVKHPPCVEVRADHVVIYPNDKIIAYNVKVYLKGKHIYTRDRWINRLNDGESTQSLVPHIGYDDDQGFKVRYNYSLDLSDNNTLRADVKYYSKVGWRPMFSDTQYERNFYIRYQEGFDEDDDDNWIRKMRDIKFGYRRHKFSDYLPLNYSGYISHGLWKDDYHRSWHTEYAVFIDHDPIYLTHDQRPLTLNLGVGRKWIDESEADHMEKTWLYSATMSKGLGAGFNTWLGYYWQKRRASIFDYGRPDMDRELQFGLAKSFGNRDHVTFITRYDEAEHNIYEYIWRWSHDFCCFRLMFEYRDKRYSGGDDEWDVQYELFRW
jgi:hypothetical protein